MRVAAWGFSNGHEAGRTHVTAWKFSNVHEAGRTHVIAWGFSNVHEAGRTHMAAWGIVMFMKQNECTFPANPYFSATATCITLIPLLRCALSKEC